MITENEIKILGFKRETLDDDGCGSTEYYYHYDIVRGLSLISNTNLQAKKSGWTVEIFNVDPKIEFSDFFEVQVFINSMESKIKK